MIAFSRAANTFSLPSALPPGYNWKEALLLGFIIQQQCPVSQIDAFWSIPRLLH